MKELIPFNYNAEICIVEEYKQEDVASWEELVSFGMVNREKKDISCWTLGCLALLVDKYYLVDKLGEDATTKDKLSFFSKKNPSAKVLWAIEIGMDPRTIKNYAYAVKSYLNICKTSIEKMDIKNLPEKPFKSLSFTHLIVAACLDDKDKVKVLQEDEDNNWTIAKLKEAILKYTIKDKKILDQIEAGEKVKFSMGEYVKVDEERKVIWVHRNFASYKIMFI
ncbi:MAG: hypothetical protein WC679_13860 [Bacteroidales bacterium]|jgi:hypothetical protein